MLHEAPAFQTHGLCSPAAPDICSSPVAQPPEQKPNKSATKTLGAASQTDRLRPGRHRQGGAVSTWGRGPGAHAAPGRGVAVPQHRLGAVTAGTPPDREAARSRPSEEALLRGLVEREAALHQLISRLAARSAQRPRRSWGSPDRSTRGGEVCLSLSSQNGNTSTARGLSNARNSAPRLRALGLYIHGVAACHGRV